MAIPRFMAPNVNVGKTCSNCFYRHEQSTLKRCVTCKDKGNAEDPFPLHQVDEIEA